MEREGQGEVMGPQGNKRTQNRSVGEGRACCLASINNMNNNVIY